MYYRNVLLVFETIEKMMSELEKILENDCELLLEIRFSDNPQTI